MQRLYKIREIAELASVNVFTIRKAIAEGELQAVRVRGAWRVTEEAFRRFLKPVPAKVDR